MRRKTLKMLQWWFFDMHRLGVKKKLPQSPSMVVEMKKKGRKKLCNFFSKNGRVQKGEVVEEGPIYSPKSSKKSPELGLWVHIRAPETVEGPAARSARNAPGRPMRHVSPIQASARGQQCPPHGNLIQPSPDSAITLGQWEAATWSALSPRRLRRAAQPHVDACQPPQSPHCAHRTRCARQSGVATCPRRTNGEPPRGTPNYTAPAPARPARATLVGRTY